jgi:hypothetical protein
VNGVVFRYENIQVYLIYYGVVSLVDAVHVEVEGLEAEGGLASLQRESGVTVQNELLSCTCIS